MIAAVAVATALAASLITLSMDIRRKVAKELRSFGANILVEPATGGLADMAGQRRYLRERDLVKVKTIFWRHNILGISPFLKASGELSFNGHTEGVKLQGAWYDKQLPVPGEKTSFSAGIKNVSPWWEIEGKWPEDDGHAIVGTLLARKLGISAGDDITLDGKGFIVSGTVRTGGPEDSRVFLDLHTLQHIKGLDGRLSGSHVSALTRPMDEFAYKNPDDMTPAEYEKWYCTGYVTSISRQIEEVFAGSRAKPIWKVAQTEGSVLNRLELLTYLLCAIALVSSVLGVSTTMLISLLRRTDEIGLMKALGASSRSIAAIFLTEGFFIGLAGGIAGCLASVFVARYIGLYVFNTALQQQGFLIPVSIGSAVLISLAGTLLPIQRAMRIRPAIALKGA